MKEAWPGFGFSPHPSRMTRTNGVLTGVKGQAPGWNHQAYSSPDHVVGDFAGHVGQAEVAALVVVGQPLVVDPEQMQDRRVFQSLSKSCTIRPPRSTSRRTCKAFLAKLDALVRARQKAGASGGATTGDTRAAIEVHEGRQIRVLAPEATAHPRPKARPSHPSMPRHHEELRGVMVDLLDMEQRHRRPASPRHTSSMSPPGRTTRRQDPGGRRSSPRRPLRPSQQ